MLFYREKVNENLSFFGDSLAKQLLLNTRLLDQWLVPLVENPVQSPPKVYLEASHTSKMDL